MKKDYLPKYNQFHTIIFDFDGIFTNNKVLVSEDGSESVICDRSDGLGLDLLRIFKEKYEWDLELFVISTEKNIVVKKRTEKLKIACFYGVRNKLSFLKNYLSKSKNKDVNGIIYLGNDLNDLKIMRYVGCSIAPCDAHQIIQLEADYVLPKKGGSGFVRYFIEKLLRIDENKNLLEELLK